MPTWLPMSASPHLHTCLETWVPQCGTVCVPVTLLQFTDLCVCISTCIYVHLLSMSSLPTCIVTWKDGFLCVALCVCCSHPSSGPTPWLECVYALVHVYIYIYPSDFQYHLKPLCIVTWKHGCPCVALCLCTSHLISVPTPWLECVRASVHVYTSTWLPMSTPSL